MAQNIELKQKLEEELETLKKELATVGRINPENPKDWEPTAGVEAEHEHEPDPNDKADELEEYETNTAILKELENRRVCFIFFQLVRFIVGVGLVFVFGFHASCRFPVFRVFRINSPHRCQLLF